MSRQYTTIERVATLRILSETRKEYGRFLKDLEAGIYDGREKMAEQTGAHYRATIAECETELKACKPGEPIPHAMPFSETHPEATR